MKILADTAGFSGKDVMTVGRILQMASYPKTNKRR